MTDARDSQEKTELRDGMIIDWDAPIPMDDGVVLRADVFRPAGDGRFPALLTYGPYAKGLAFQDGYPDAWETMAREHPDVVAGSTNLYQNWEVADPEKWVPHGYVCVRVDSRGCGRSPGFVDPFSPRETRDFAACIAWAGEDRKSTRLNSSHSQISYAVFCLKKKKMHRRTCHDTLHTLRRSRRLFLVR